MANHKDAIKRARQNENARMRNRHYRTRMRTEIKRLRSSIESNDLATAQELLPKAVSVIQRVAQKGIIHERQAARRVSRLTQAVNALAAAKKV